MAKSFPIPARKGRFLPHVSSKGISNPAAAIVRDGKLVVMGDTGANPLVLAKPNGNCCCNDEIPGCPVCSHRNNDLLDSAYFDCGALRWKFDDAFTCQSPNDQTLCCRTFLPTPFAHVQMQTSLGDFYFANACFSMRVFLEAFIPADAIIVAACIGVNGIRFLESERKAETMEIFITAKGAFRESFGEIPCAGIRDNDDDAFDAGFELTTNITQWENVTSVNTKGVMPCGEQGSFGNSCKIKPANGTIIAQVTETLPLGFLPFDPPFTFLWQQFFDSRDYLDSAFTTQFQIEPEAAIGIRAEHSNAPC